MGFIYQLLSSYVQDTRDMGVNVLCLLKLLINIKESSLFLLNIQKIKAPHLNPYHSLIARAFCVSDTVGKQVKCVGSDPFIYAFGINVSLSCR